MSKDTNRCKSCGTLYQKGFFGAGYKYCSQRCSKSYWRVKRNEYNKKRYQRLHKKSTCCNICGRDIGRVGSRENISKYCSTRCMGMGIRQRKGQKYCYVRIPVVVQKSVKILIKDIPLILTRGGPKLTER